MYQKTIGFAIALMIAAVVIGVGPNVCRKSAQAAEPTTAMTPADPDSVPEGWVLVEEDVLTVFVDSPGEHFHKARQSFLKKDYKAAAEEIRKGAAFLKLQAARAAVEGRKGLTVSVGELEKLAEDIEKGTVTSAKTLDNAFARAHHALAKHHYLKALDNKAKKDGRKLGHDLKAAARHLEHGLAWAGHELEAATVRIIMDTGLLAGKLIEGTGWITEEVGKAIDKIGEEIMKLGRMLEPAKPKKM